MSSNKTEQAALDRFMSMGNDDDVTHRVDSSLMPWLPDGWISGPADLQMIGAFIIGAIFVINLMVVVRRRYRKLYVDKASYERARDHLDGKKGSKGEDEIDPN